MTMSGDCIPDMAVVAPPGLSGGWRSIWGDLREDHIPCPRASVISPSKTIHAFTRNISNAMHAQKGHAVILAQKAERRARFRKGKTLSVSSKLNTTLLAVLACLLWSTAFVGIKIGLAYTTPLNFAGIRFFIAGVMVLPFAGKPEALRSILLSHFRFVGALSLLSTALVYTFFYHGISLGSASTAAIVMGSSPLFIAVMTHLFIPNDKLTLKKGAAILLGIVGVTVIAVSRYREGASSGHPFWAVVLLIGSVVSGGFSNILMARSPRDVPPLALSALQLVFGGVMLFVISLFTEPVELAVKPAPYYGALVYLSGLSAGAMTIWLVLLRRPEVKVSEINLWKFLIPVAGAILSWILLEGDRPDPAQIFGMVVIAAALVLIHLKRPPRPELKASKPMSAMK
jgi:drug/metabolite transporter (DMT)-like permease